ncbi:MAG TPA: alpha/beta fold hydrolase [Candidatus Limnocylindrales bacterium]|jgi:pimeloyl-ACP methyl ester carboxylesterase|nr:alpha/beta fold hydrolase [Candidatus Limnocylindrales bacterium]
MQLNFKSYGTGEPLIILHGLFGSLDNWHSVGQNLADRFHVLAVDQRNHGNSPHSDEMTYTAMAKDLAELLEREGSRSAHLLGHSMGGKTAMQFALLFPSVVRSLIVADISPRADSPRHATIFSALLALDLSAFKTRTEVLQALAPPIPDLALRQFLVKNLSLDHGGGLRWKIGLKEIFHNYDRLREAVDGAGTFKGSTLFVRGEYSDYLLESDLPAIKQLFPGARLETLPHAGHLMHVENREAFIKLIRDFLLTS